MPNQSRRHLGLYYLALKSGIERGVYLSDKDYPDFLDLLLSVLAGSGYKLYAFCLLPGQVHMAVRMSHVPLADFMQRLTIRYDEWIQEKRDRTGNLQNMQEPKLFDRHDKLRELVRFIHLLPLKVGCSPCNYLWSGQRTYLGKTRMTCVDSRAGLQLFGRDCHEARASYERYFQEGLDAVTSGRFPQPSASMERKKAHAPAAGTSRDICAIESLDELAARISQIGNKQIDDVRSCSRERSCSLVRAVIMWHATRLECASATEVSQYLRRDPSSLYSAVKRYSTLHPDLFSRPGDFQELKKLSDAEVNGQDIEVRRISLRRVSATDCPGPN